MKKKVVVFVIILSLFVPTLAIAAPVAPTLQEASGQLEITPSWIAISQVDSMLRISSTGLAECEGSANCDRDYSVGVVVSLVRELGNGGTTLQSWPSKIEVGWAGTYGIYQLPAQNPAAKNWYHTMTVATAYREGGIRETVELKSVSRLY